MHNASAHFRNMPNDAETFGSIPQSSATFRTVPNASERKENHTLTVREVARLFEDADVARTERSIINWCQPDKHGGRRLDCYFDQNERKYFITPQSVARAITEEQAKTKSTPTQSASEPFRKVPAPHSSETENGTGNTEAQRTGERERTLRAQVRRLTLEGEVSKRYIEKLESEREKSLERMMAQSRQIGVLETTLLQLEGPKHTEPRTVYTDPASRTRSADDLPAHDASEALEP